MTDEELYETEKWKRSSINTRWMISNYGRVGRNEGSGLVLLVIKMSRELDEYCVYDRFAKTEIPVYDLYLDAWGLPDDPDWTPSLSRVTPSMIQQSDVNWRVSKPYRKQVYKNNPGFTHFGGFVGH